MSRRRVALAVSVLAAAVAIVLLLLRDRGPQRGPAAPAGPEARAAAPARPRVPARLPLSPPSPETPADATLPARFEGHVVSRANGAGIPGAELTFSRAGAAASVLTGADGAFRFDPPTEGRWLLAAVTARGFLPFAPEWGHSPVQLDARAGHPVRGLAIHLAPADPIEGRAVDAQGRPAAGASIRLLGVAGEAALVSIPDRFTADEEGAFTFSAPEGTVVEARLPGRAPGRAEVDLPVMLERRLTVAIGGPQTDAPPATIAGRVVARDGGAPVAGALVAASRPRRFALSGPSAAQAMTSADGTFELEGLDPGPWLVRARAEGLAPATRRAVAGARDVVLELAAGGRLRGCVTDASGGGPVAPFTVLVLARPTPLFRFPQASRSFVDASGCWALDGLRSGPVAVVVSAPGYAPSEEVATEVPESGEAIADVSVRRGGRLTGAVRDAETGAPLAGARLQVEGNLPDAASTFPVLADATTDETGRFVLEGLPRRSSISIAAAGHHGRILGGVEVPPGGEAGPVEIALRPLAPGETPRTELAGIGVSIAPRGEALAVTALSPGGGAEEAGLAAGDLIVAVAGRPVAELGMGGAVDAIRGPEGSFVVLTIRRGDATREVRVPRRLVRG